MKNILRLRFVIGAFCTLNGILMLSQGFSDKYSGEWNLNKTIGWGYEDRSSIKIWCGAILMILGIITVVLSLKKHSRNKLLPKE